MTLLWMMRIIKGNKVRLMNNPGYEKQVECKKRVLVVDDEVLILNILRVQLWAAGFQVSVATNGKEALESFIDTKPDIVLTDLIMPDMDGAYVLAQIREISSIPVIIVSAIEPREMGVYNLIHGADGYITKPFYTETLISKIVTLTSHPRALATGSKK